MISSAPLPGRGARASQRGPSRPGQMLPACEDLGFITGPQGLHRLWRPSPTVTDGGSEEVLLLTVQSPATYARLREDRRLTGPTWGQVDPAMRPAYEWMSRRLAHRAEENPSTRPESDVCALRAPLWAWAYAEPDRMWDEISSGIAAPPQAEVETQGPPGPATGAEHEVVLVAFVANASQTVFSAHEAWHHALNGTWCPAPRHNAVDADEHDAYSRFLAEADAVMGGTSWTVTDLPDRLRHKIAASWRWALIPALFPHSPVQAAVTDLEAAQVTGAVRARTHTPAVALS